MPSTGCPWWDRDSLKRELIEQDGNKTAVAESLGTTYHTIHEWVERHELEEFTTGNAKTGLPDEIKEVV